MSEDLKFWEALGGYIAQNFLRRKGVMIPGFGTFTFTTQVSLDGVNPAMTKDRDDRLPVFIVSSELAPGVRSGIYHGSGIRPYTNKGVSGVTPTVKLNLAELAQFAGSGKDGVAKSMDVAVRRLAEMLKKGDARVEIPGLGTLVSKNSIVAVIFNKELKVPVLPGTLTEDGARWLKEEMGIELEAEEKRRGGLKGSAGKMDGLENAEESRIMSRPFSADKLRANREEIEFPISQGSVNSLKMQSLDSAFLRTVKKDTTNIDFIIDNQSKLQLMFSIKDPGRRGLLPTEEFMDCIRMLENPKLTEQVLVQLIALTGCKSSNKIHYNIFMESLAKMRSGALKKPAASVRSDFTANYTKSSVIPLAQKIWDKRLELTKQSQENGMRPRFLCSASELLSILRKSEISLNIHQLKAVLRDCGMTQASPLDLIKGVRNLLSPDSRDVSVISDFASQASNWAPMQDGYMSAVKKYLNDFNLQEFFRKAVKKNGVLELDDFVEYISQQSRGVVKGFEAEHAFRKASKGKLFINEAEFVSAFKAVENTRKADVSSLERVKKWLKLNRFSALQGFNKLLEYAGARDVFTMPQFGTAVSRIGIDAQESEAFFRHLDSKNDNRLDLAEWKEKIYEEANADLNEMRETILTYNLDPNEILLKMDLRGKSKLSLEELCHALQRLDPSLTLKKSVDIASSLAGSNPDISVSEVIEKLSSQPDSNWLRNLIEKVKAQGKFEQAKKLFEEIDQRCMGKIEVSAFADCAKRAGLGLSFADIERLSRVLGKGMNTIDYVQFLDKIRPRVYLSDPFKSTVNRLMVYFRQNSIKPEEFFIKSGGKMPVARFAEFLTQKIQKELTSSESLSFAARLDINGDGFIDATDLLSFFDSRSEVEQVSALSADKAALILADLRKVLASKKWGYQETFNFFDSEKNGLISSSEFIEGIGKLIEISPEAKLSLFQFINKQGLGLIDFQTFSEVLKYSDLKTTRTNDSWEWENTAIDKIRYWISKEGISIEEGFRAFDKDFDGVLSKEDLKKALVSVLKYSEAELVSSKIERLYKLLDIYKRNIVQLSDFKFIFEEKRTPEWKDAAKQTIGLFVSKKYRSNKEAFETIAGNAQKITLKAFCSWLESTQVLTDYRLTAQLIQELFTFMDPHKKGFLSLDDWQLCTGTFSYSSSCLQEVKDAIRSNFSDVQAAFDYFLALQNSTSDKINSKSFEKGLESIIPNRFSKTEILSIWSDAFGSVPLIGFPQFKELFDDKRYTNFSTPARGRASSARTLTSMASSKSSLSEDPLKRLQALIKASPYTIEDIFREMDKDNSGTLSVMEFRNAMRKLNIGLSSKEIDKLLARIDTNNDGKIDWQEFEKQFKSSESQNHIKASCQQRLNALRVHMSTFMLSPKDAFNQFDVERAGKLSFTAFSSLIQKLYELAREPMPSFAVVKDLFDIIDIRKDGVLDMREWLNTFKEAERSTWEDSKQYDDICAKIAKNRKVLLEFFERNGRAGKVQYEQAKQIMSDVLKEYRLAEENWRKIVGVACRDGAVDYRTMLDIYKQRCTSAQQHPR